MWACCPSRHCLYSLTPALEWLLKPTQKTVIYVPSPPEEFQAFSFTRPCFSILSTSLLHTWIWFLATTHKASLRAPAGLRGLYHPLPTFCTKAKYYLHVKSTTTSMPFMECCWHCPQAGGCAQSREQSSACTAMHSTGSVQLHSRWTFLLLNDGKGRDYFCLTVASVPPSPWTHVPNISMFSR